ncbi:MAG TPA: TylF/MycF/NovP-related O-methyltransferase [Alphaproteobacteria bacterium]
MRALLKKTLSQMPLPVRLGIIRAGTALRLDSALPIPRAARSLAAHDFQTWIKRYITSATPFFLERTDLYRYVYENFMRNRAIAYYEFGVHEGRSIHFWSQMVANLDSRFYGFDSFEGLPEDWDPENPKGTFNVAGNIPELHDDRVAFIKGWFQDTLPVNQNLFETNMPKIIHLDADLYSSTMTVFDEVGATIKPNDIVIFDEFCDIAHEFRALGDYCANTGRNYEVLGATSFFVQVAIRFKN